MASPSKDRHADCAKAMSLKQDPVVLAEKIGKSRLLQELPKNERKICTLHIDEERKSQYKIVQHCLKSFNFPKDTEDLQKFKIILETYKQVYNLNKFIEDLALIPTRLNKKLIKKLSNFIKENYKNIDLDYNLFDVTFKPKNDVVEYQKMINEKLNKILNIILNQKDLNEENFKEYLIDQL